MTFFGIPVKIVNNQVYEYIEKDDYNYEINPDIYIENGTVYQNRTLGNSTRGKYQIYEDPNTGISYLRIKASNKVNDSFSITGIYDFNGGEQVSVKQNLGQVKEGKIVPDKSGADDFVLKPGKIKISVCNGNRMTFQIYDESERSYKKLYGVNFKKILTAGEYYIYFFVSEINMLTKVGAAFEMTDCS